MLRVDNLITMSYKVQYFLCCCPEFYLPSFSNSLGLPLINFLTYSDKQSYSNDSPVMSASVHFPLSLITDAVSNCTSEITDTITILVTTEKTSCHMCDWLYQWLFGNETVKQKEKS